MLNLYQLANSKAQLNIRVSHTREHTGMIVRLWRKGFCKQVSFELLPEEGNRCCTAYIVRKVIPNLRNIKGKNYGKVFD